MTRRSPIKHRVEEHSRGGHIVREHSRGSAVARIPHVMQNLYSRRLAKYEYIPGLSRVFPKQILITHDTPIENLKSILKLGLYNEDEGHFGTLGYLPETGFVLSKKAVVHIVLPTNARNLSSVTIDMRYNDEDDFLQKHPRLIGGDVSINRNVPLSLIKDITVDGKKVYNNPRIKVKIV